MATSIVSKQQKVIPNPRAAAVLSCPRQTVFPKVPLPLYFCFLLLVLFVPEALHAQTFQAVPAMNFNKAFGTTNPLPQVFTVASTGANFNFSATASTTSGGSWLSITQGNGCCYATPQAITVTAAPDATLAAGTYSGQILVKSQNGAQSMTIPVTLTVKAASSAFFDNMIGGLTFSLQTNSGSIPPAQSIQVRNGGTGSLAWTASASTADGGKWLTLSASSGTAPGYLNVSVVPSKLPGLAITAGTYSGQVLLKTSGDTATIPVTVTVGDSVFPQVSPLYFTKLYAGGNPVSQVVTIATTGANFNFYATAASSTGGNWLSITQGNGCCYATPQAITVTVNPDVTLAAGIYSSEVIVKSQNGSDALVIPVTLAVEPKTASFFDQVGGELTFSMTPDGKAPPAQAIPIQNAGSGSLAWTAAASTSDGGAWLTVSPASGTAPSYLSVSVNPAKLPGGSLTPGSFTGQVVLQAGQVRVTVPVTMYVGDDVFEQVAPLNFTKLYAGADPLPQVITFSSTGANFNYYVSAVSSTGGNWLSVTHSNGCCYTTPDSVTVAANPDVTLAAGTYHAEVIAKSQTGNDSVVVPVTLTIASPSASFFDSLPGQLTFSMITKGIAPPVQSIQIRNGGAGALVWTATKTTSDGGNWLTLSAASGTAPAFLNVGITPANLPGGSLTAGTFTGQVVLVTGQDRVTIPITVQVGPQVFQQNNPISFTKEYAGANPLPQVVTFASNGSNFNYYVTAVNSTGGNWLSVTHSNGCCYTTPDAITVTANPAVTLAAGTYSAEIIAKSQSGSLVSVVAVTLTVEPSTATFFDTLPGEVTFSATTTGGAIPAQVIPVRNAGVGTLNWTATATTADGNHWLTAAPASSTSPSNLTVTVTRGNLPGKGLVAGTFVGQVLLQTGTDRVTLPVEVTIGASVFKQLPAMQFTKNYGGANPAAQSITIDTTSAALNHSSLLATSTGGNWLTITHGNGCCYATPDVITVTPAPATALAPGVYTAEIAVTTQSGSESMLVPVQLTINGTAATAAPKFTPPAGSYSSTQVVTLSSATDDAAIYYTLDGSTPTTSSKLYTAPITVNTSETIKAIAAAPGYKTSAVATAAYTLTAPTAATPQPTQTVAITEVTPGATVYYTTNGSVPTTKSTKYTGPITFTTSAVLKFIAVAPGYNQSAVRTITVTVQ